MRTETDRGEQLESTVTDLAVETWRFSRLFERVVEKLDAGEQTRYGGQLRYFAKKVADHLAASGLTLVTLEGQVFDEGMAAVALNLDEFRPEDVLLIDQMVEPIVMGPHGLKRPGTVLLRKAEV